jgi:hypothetical protein
MKKINKSSSWSWAKLIDVRTTPFEASFEFSPCIPSGAALFLSICSDFSDLESIKFLMPAKICLDCDSTGTRLAH